MMLQNPKMPHRGKLVVSAAVVVAAVGLAMLAMLVVGDSEPAAVSASVAGPPVRIEKGTKMPPVKKSDAEWKAQLTPEQYHVTREKGTERAFTGQYWNHKEDGVYKCICCGAELFKSDTKYDSHCGWPSFYASDSPQNLHEEVDRTHGMMRTEVTCSSCGAHLGHVFDDGPQPTGVRYCMNSASLQFEKKPEPEQSKKEEK